MTFNATSHNILLKAGYVQRNALRPLPLIRRQLFVSQDISDLFDGKVPDSGFPHVLADLLLSWYLAGSFVTASLRFRKGIAPNLERLDGLIDDVWAMCFRSPRPGWRLLGRFLDRDVFVGLRAYDRHQIDSTRAYSLAAYEVIADWEKLFGAIDPVRGAQISDYLGGVWRDVNEAN